VTLSGRDIRTLHTLGFRVRAAGAASRRKGVGGRRCDPHRTFSVCSSKESRT
jgi:hypothetical protein